MKFFTTDQSGITIVEPSEAQREAILQSVVENADEADYPEAFLNGSRGIVIGFRSDGCLLWEDSGTVTKYLPDCDIDTASTVWTCLAKADWSGLDSMEWQPIQ